MAFNAAECCAIAAATWPLTAAFALALAWPRLALKALAAFRRQRERIGICRKRLESVSIGHNRTKCVRVAGRGAHRVGVVATGPGMRCVARHRRHCRRVRRGRPERVEIAGVTGKGARVVRDRRKGMRMTRKRRKGVRMLRHRGKGVEFPALTLAAAADTALAAFNVAMKGLRILRKPVNACGLAAIAAIAWLFAASAAKPG